MQTMSEALQVSMCSCPTKSDAADLTSESKSRASLTGQVRVRVFLLIIGSLAGRSADDGNE